MKRKKMLELYIIRRTIDICSSCNFAVANTIQKKVQRPRLFHQMDDVGSRSTSGTLQIAITTHAHEP